MANAANDGVGAAGVPLVGDAGAGVEGGAGVMPMALDPMLIGRAVRSHPPSLWMRRYRRRTVHTLHLEGGGTAEYECTHPQPYLDLAARFSKESRHTAPTGPAEDVPSALLCRGCAEEERALVGGMGGYPVDATDFMIRANKVNNGVFETHDLVYWGGWGLSFVVAFLGYAKDFDSVGRRSILKRKTVGPSLLWHALTHPSKTGPSAVMFSVYYVSVTFFDAILSDWALHLLRLKNNSYGDTRTFMWAEDLAVSSLTRAVSEALVSPLQVTLIRLQLQDDDKPLYDGAWSAFKALCEEEDLRAVKLSVVPLVITSAIFAISSDYTEKMFNRALGRRPITVVDTLLDPVLPEKNTFVWALNFYVSSLVGSILSMPSKAVETLLVVQGSPLQEMYGVPDLSSPWEAVNFLFDRDGVGGFFTGLLPDATQTIPFLALGVILSSATDFVFNTVMAGDDDVEAGDEDIDDLP